LNSTNDSPCTSPGRGTSIGSKSRQTAGCPLRKVAFRANERCIHRGVVNPGRVHGPRPLGTCRRCDQGGVELLTCNLTLDLRVRSRDCSKSCIRCQKGLGYLAASLAYRKGEIPSPRKWLSVSQKLILRRLGTTKLRREQCRSWLFPVQLNLLEIKTVN